MNSQKDNSRQPGQSGPLVFGMVMAVVAVVGIIALAITRMRSPGGQSPTEQTNGVARAVASPANGAAGAQIGTNTADTAAQATNTVSAPELIAQGNNLLKQNKPQEALELYKSALKELPDDEDVHFNMGLALAHMGKTNEAKVEYQEALKLFPDYTEAHNNLGNMLMKEGNFKEAVEHFQAALKNDPQSASSHNNLGTALARQGKVTEGVMEFMEAVRINPQYADAHCNLGNAYVTQNRYEEAAQEFQKALATNPQFQPALRGLAKVRQKLATP